MSDIQPIDYNVAWYYPREVMANLTRAQWADFENTALPIKRQLEGMTTYNGNTGVVGALQDQSRANVQNAYANVIPDAQRNAQSYGMSLSPATQGTLERSSKLGMAAATADGLNRANDYQRDLNRQIVAGSAMASGGRNYN